VELQEEVSPILSCFVVYWHSDLQVLRSVLTIDNFYLQHTWFTKVLRISYLHHLFI